MINRLIGKRGKSSKMKEKEKNPKERKRDKIKNFKHKNQK